MSATIHTLNIYLPSLKYGCKLKGHDSYYANGSIFIYGGEDQLTTETSFRFLEYKVNDGYLYGVDASKRGVTLPLKGHTLFPYYPDNDERRVFVSFGGQDIDERDLYGFTLMDLSLPHFKIDAEMNGTWEVPGFLKFHTRASMNDRHYFFGGTNEKEQAPEGVYCFDSNTQTFSFYQSRGENNNQSFIPPPLINHASCCYKEFVLFLGGDTIKNGENLKIYRFNTKTKEWTAPIDFLPDVYPNGISGHRMCVVGDVLVIVGGSIPGGANDDSGFYSPAPRKVVFYDFNTKEWIYNFNLNGPFGNRIGHTLHAIDDQLWIIGGDVDNIADQDVVVIQCDYLSSQPNVRHREIDFITASIPQSLRASFPPPKSPFDSEIITCREGMLLNKWYGVRKQKWRLLYRGTRDGFHASKWHGKVDGQGPTISLVRVQNYVFGGYTPIPWNSSGADQYDDDSWIFSLRNPHDSNSYVFKKIPACVKNIRSVYHASGYGLWFGANDILIYSNADSNSSSNATLGKSYEYSLTYDPNTFFCGQSTFQVDELETFGLL